ncbi:ribosomal protein S12 methylthiotransferase accessory factor [Nocardiopsis sp. Huas11]|uniref:YcaO-like family protein n=1 Tax=Nocardiopsis sp. Huas11 TaxID=2183912 RepID=UPI000EB42894|nr:YcaO-like family protein [Nocardiopsis sp. Huas11]RKS08139.1 ribosomal protein S12 methylthiotransferase accessory factor [Nocardiopsis sp. Huas11]
MVRPAWVLSDGEPDATTRLPGPGDAQWSGTFERELTLAEADRRIRADIAAQGWVARHRSLDDTDPTAVQCALWDAGGAEIPYGLGAGKGPGAPAHVGARFEAVEHAFTGPTILESLPVRLVDASALATGPFAADRAVRDIAAQDGARVACVRYEALDGGADVDVPVYLWAPWYSAPTPEATAVRRGLGDTADYRSALAYSVNSGCAIGATGDEALLHALNEWVERDAFALFLLRSVYDGGPMPPALSRADLPETLRAHLERAETLVGGPVTLLDLTTDLGVPTVMAYGHRPCGPNAGSGPETGSKHRYGLGASLWGTLAAERAITEFVQDELLSRMVSEQVASGDGSEPYAALIAEHDIEAHVLARLRDHPRLLACATLDFADRLPESPQGALPRETVPKGTPVPEQHSEVVRRITAAGHRVAAHRLQVLAHGTTVVQVQCPGLERFHLVTQGHLALPGSRGRGARAGARTRVTEQAAR